jgi:ArsR family transcriptional regulator, arsenate/arsenite/antimonite-responsive transcriptional repressor
MREFLSITKALADESRVRLLLSLNGGELCACQLTELLGFAPSTVSKHLSILHQAGLVNSRKEGRWIYYSLPGGAASPAARDAAKWVQKSLAADARIARDRIRVQKIRKQDPAELCQRQCRK